MSWTPNPNFGAGAVSGGGITAFSTAVPLDGTKRMPPTQVPGPLTFTVSGTPVAGGICTIKLTANGVNTPVFPGIHWGGSAGWVNTGGTVNVVTIWNDGDVTYYSIAQHQSAPITLPSLTAALKSGASSPSTLALTLSAELGNSGNVDTSQFAVTTTNAGAQTDNVLTASASGATVTIGLSRPATVGDITSISYTPNATAGLRLVDAAGNYIYSLSGAPVVVQTFAGILDGLGASAAGAWSLRRLTSAYAGPLIRVIGSVQGAFDAGFNSATGDMDMTRLTGASGETYSVNTIYDQSGGGRHQIATTTSGLPTLQLTGGPKSGLPIRIASTVGDKIAYAGTNLESVFLASGRIGSQFLVQSCSSYQDYAGGAGGASAADASTWLLRLSRANATTPIVQGLAPTFFDVKPNPPDFGVLVGSMIASSASSAVRVLRTISSVKTVISSGSLSDTTTASSLIRWGFFCNASGNVNSSHYEQIQFASDVGTTIRNTVENSQLAYWGV